MALAAVAVAGCGSTPPSQSERSIVETANTPTATPTTGPSTDNPSVARINGLTVTRSELDDVLYRAFGVNMLAQLVELDLAEQALKQKGLTVTEADVAAERTRYMAGQFGNDTPEHYEQDFKQLKASQHITEAQFDLALRMTAALRKIVAPLVASQVTEDAVRTAFGLLYGENRRIADIQVGNIVQWGQVQQQLKTLPFATVAQRMSQDDETKRNGGVWPPFSRKTPLVPPVIMEAAFGMKVNEVSREPLVDGDRYHVIRLLQIIPPKIVNYDDVKADVRRQVEEQGQQQGINQLRKQLQQIAVQGITIDDPTLKQAWDAMIAAQQPAGQTLSPGDAVKKIHAAEKPSATGPATAP